ncbi:diguanylate cyclase [Halarcobacter sp.]|uniref:diguanylate cyclase n=1 Tax=Halarcobacter sp. TaxID=2321133 RepID=UPI003A913A65
MIPDVLDIAIKDIVTIDSNKRLEEAVKKMAASNLRTIVITDTSSYKILTTTQLIDFKLERVDHATKLKDLGLREVKVINKSLNLINLLNQINSTEEYMVIVDENSKLEGILSYTDIINNIDPQMLMERQTLGNLILNYQAIFAYEDSSALHAVKLIKNSGNDAVIIKNNDEKAVGIFTSKDFINLIHLDSDLTQKISNFMTSPIKTLKEHSTIADALAFIRKQRFKRIIIENDKGYVTGIISQKELLRIVYNKWIELMKKEGSKISKTNEALIQTQAELEEIASTDYLTKIYNRQKFESFLEYEIKKLDRYENGIFTILLVDIDHFKKVNDSYGHLKGDSVLQEFSKILTFSSRKSDVVARWGGEEFIVLLPHTSIEEAILVAEKIRSTVEVHDFKDNLMLTCSVGISQYHKNDTKREIFNRADNALYKAKALGRNRIEIEVLSCNV